jgi:hypothetical protein
MLTHYATTPRFSRNVEQRRNHEMLKFAIFRRDEKPLENEFVNILQRISGHLNPISVNAFLKSQIAV